MGMADSSETPIELGFFSYKVDTNNKKLLGDDMVISYKTHTKLSEVYFLLGLSVYTVVQYLIFFFNDLDALHRS